MGKPVFTFPRKLIGPIKWCTTCSRKHEARAGCGLVKVTRTAKSGKEVERWAHPDSSARSSTRKTRKTKVRKS